MQCGSVSTARFFRRANAKLHACGGYLMTDEIQCRGRRTSDASGWEQATMPRTPSTAERRDTNGNSWTAAAGAFARPAMSRCQSRCLIMQFRSD